MLAVLNRIMPIHGILHHMLKIFRTFGATLSIVLVKPVKAKLGRSEIRRISSGLYMKNAVFLFI